MNKDLTEKQSKFVDLLFSEEYMDDPRGAMRAAGYSDFTTVAEVMAGVRDEILRRTDTYITIHVPKCVNKILQVVDTPNGAGAKTQLDAAQSILDRAGVSKKERLEVDVKTPSGLVFLPPKKTD